MNYEFLNTVIANRKQISENLSDVPGAENLTHTFLRDFSNTPDNTEAIERIEYGPTNKHYEPSVLTYGLKIKEKNISLADVAYELECQETADFLKQKLPELSMEDIAAAQRLLTTIMLSLEYRKRIDCNSSEVPELLQ